MDPTRHGLNQHGAVDSTASVGAAGRRADGAPRRSSCGWSRVEPPSTRSALEDLVAAGDEAPLGRHQWGAATSEPGKICRGEGSPPSGSCHRGEGENGGPRAGGARCYRCVAASGDEEPLGCCHRDLPPRGRGRWRAARGRRPMPSETGSTFFQSEASVFPILMASRIG